MKNLTPPLKNISFVLYHYIMLHIIISYSYRNYWKLYVYGGTRSKRPYIYDKEFRNTGFIHQIIEVWYSLEHCQEWMDFQTLFDLCITLILCFVPGSRGRRVLGLFSAPVMKVPSVNMVKLVLKAPYTGQRTLSQTIHSKWISLVSPLRRRGMKYKQGLEEL